MPHSTRVTNTIWYTPKLPNEHCGRELLSAGAVVVPIASTTVVYKSTDERPVASGEFLRRVALKSNRSLASTTVVFAPPWHAEETRCVQAAWRNLRRRRSTRDMPNQEGKQHESSITSTDPLIAHRDETRCEIVMVKVNVGDADAVVCKDDS